MSRKSKYCQSVMCSICQVQFQKIFILPHRRDWNFLVGGGLCKAKKLIVKKCMKLNWNFQRGGGSYKKSLPWGRYGYFLEHLSSNANSNAI